MAVIHKTAEVYSNAIGEDTHVWQFAVVLEGAVIGNNCNINCHTFIENDVTIGNNVTVKSGVYLWAGISVGNNAFIGPNATFTNDKYPRSKEYPEEFQKTFVGDGASIGANATILGGLTIGRFAIIGAGSVVTKDVPAFALIKGNPGKICGWVGKNGDKLLAVGDEGFMDKSGRKYILKAGELFEA